MREWMDAFMHIGMDGWMDEWIQGWMRGWIEGGMQECRDIKGSNFSLWREGWKVSSTPSIILATDL